MPRPRQTGTCGCGQPARCRGMCLRCYGEKYRRRRGQRVRHAAYDVSLERDAEAALRAAEKARKLRDLCCTWQGRLRLEQEARSAEAKAADLLARTRGGCREREGRAGKTEETPRPTRVRDAKDGRGGGPAGDA